MFVNPFEVNGNWYKGNLHTHSNVSDGKLSPEETARWYKAHNYDFLSITDHQPLSCQGTAGMERCERQRCLGIPEGKKEDYPLMIPGEEISFYDKKTGAEFHLVAVNPKELIVGDDYSDMTTQETINLLRKKEAEVIIAHPYCVGDTMIDIMDLKGVTGIEIFNNVCEIRWGKGSSTALWDDLLTRGNCLAGFAVDDAHKVGTEESGGGWIMVKAKELTIDSLLEAVRDGCFYSSSGPAIYNISFLKDRMEVKCSPAKRINLIVVRHHWWKGWSIYSPKGKTITEGVGKLPDKGPKIKFLYARIEIVDEYGRKAWSNPFIL